MDNRILVARASIQKSQPKNATILVSKDINLRIKADALGLKAEDYETDRVFITDLYTGMMEMAVSRGKMAAFRANGELGSGRRQKIFSERILHADRRSEPEKSRPDQSGRDRHETGSHR